MVEKQLDRKIASPEKCAQSESSIMLNDQTIELNFVRNRLETFQTTVLRDVQKRMSGMIDEVMQELRQHELQTNEFRNFATPQMLHNHLNISNTWSNRIRTETNSPKSVKSTEKEVSNEDDVNVTNTTASATDTDSSSSGNKRRSKSKKYHALPEKIFVMRESFLTALLEVDHMKTIYHIFYIIFLVFLLNNITYEYLAKGSISFGIGTFKTSFDKIHLVAGIWMLQHIFVFSIYYSLKGWQQVRMKLDRHKNLQHLWSLSCLFTYITAQLVFAYVPTKLCLYLDLPFATSSVLLPETVRLLMKMHSFVRSVAPRVLAGKLKAEEQSGTQINFPAFNKYLYYLFAPTLLYRDEYPRTSTIRWKFALARFLEVVAVAFLYSYIHERHITQHFGNFGVEELNAASITIKLFGMLMPSIIIFLAGFYMILHAWLNFTAEIMRFGDRMFYKDWWTASNYEGYYRNWNVVVHDWLYEYIYKDFYNHIFKGSKALSSLTVFAISAVFHEYILGYALQVCFPVIFVLFGIIGVAMIFITRYIPKNLGNIFLWFSLIYGNCMMISLYSMEYYTRFNCPKEFNSWSDYLVPHLWSCYFK
ncbi:sterol O-acyltransferase 1 [Lucilia sericata]|uniref:sterol O-acyltransferase 1 n=1 Tax=Lucilia sericata TaxID=13632 RepID=UPI0018A875CA|nr:sterol O-acyltransferase 1 [Lucilia sericata]